MKPSNRDLLVLVKNEYTSDQFMEQEVELLNELLFHYETMHNFCLSHEVFDLNKYKIIRKQQLIHQVARQKELKPFQFLCNKN
jgi:hypothetical protein